MATVTAVETATPEAILQTALGFMAAKHLFVANEIHLFEALAKGACSLDELAVRTKIPKRTLRIIADAMVALDFVQKTDDEYRNSTVAAAFLTGSGPTDLRPALSVWNYISYNKWIKLEESVRAGEGKAGRFEFADKREEEIFSKGAAAFSSGGAQSLPDVHDFSHYRRVLDLGGGTGSFLLPLLKRYPALEGTVFELPAAAGVARQVLAGNPLAGRIRIVEGDVLQTPLPPGHDVVVIAHVIHTFSAEHNLQMFANLRKSVTPGARVLMVDLFTDPTHTQPSRAALMAGEFMLMTGEGDTYSEQEAREWLRATGWKALEFKPLNGPVSLMVGEAVG